MHHDGAELLAEQTFLCKQQINQKLVYLAKTHKI